MVAGIVKFFALIGDARIKNVIHTLLNQPGDMSMGELGRVTFGFTGDGFNAQRINIAVGSWGEHYFIPQFGKESKPIRVVLIHIENTWNTNFAPICLVRRKWFVMIKYSLVFIGIEIRDVLVVLFFAQSPFASVAGNELTATGKTINGQKTVIRTPLASRHRTFKS